MVKSKIQDIKFLVKCDPDGAVKPIENDTHMLYLDSCVLTDTIGWNLPYRFSAEYITEKPENWTPDPKCIYAFRGMNKAGYIKKIIAEGKPYFYSDTGYLEFMQITNYVSKTTRRMVYNGLHETTTMSSTEIFTKLRHIRSPEYLQHRFERHTGQPYNDFKLNHGNPIKKGDAILIVVPSGKSCKYYDTTEDEWLESTMNEIKKHTDRPIIIRKKPNLNKRRRRPLVEDLASGKYHAMVTFNSIASLESVMMGVPVICLGENAGSALGESKMENIENPYFPKINKIRDHFLFLSCQQFDINEMVSGEWLRIMHALKSIGK